MRAVIAGGTGFLGQALTAALVGRGDEVVILTRRPRLSTHPSVTCVTWSPEHAERTGAAWVDAIRGADVVVNLAGEGLADRRWTKARKAALFDSRVSATRALVRGIAAAGAARPPLLLSSSAVGYYGDGGDAKLDESGAAGIDFLATICVAWEAEAHKATALGCRLVVLRNGVVLARYGGALRKMLLPFLLFGGGPISSGRQYISWIHLDDWVALALWAMDSPAAAGAFNASAPNPVQNAVFMRAVGRALHRPSWLPMPGAVLRVLFGEVADITLVAGQRVFPAHAVDLGFRFRHIQIDEAIQAAMSLRRPRAL